MRSRLILLGLLACAAGGVSAQQACTDEMAWSKAGSWARSEDDLAMADRSFPKAEYPVALRKADQVVALLRQAIPKLNGIEAKAYRSIRDPSYTKEGALKYGVNALFLGLFLSAIGRRVERPAVAPADNPSGAEDRGRDHRAAGPRAVSIHHARGIPGGA
jgi:hypothetical protein